MKKLILLSLLAGAFVRQAAAAPDITLRVTPERDLVYSRGSRDVIVQIDLDGRRPDRGARRAPMNLALVFDRSGSMQGAKIEKARQAACVAVDQLADDDYFSLVMFDNTTEVLLPPERVGGASHREDLKSRIDRIRPGGGTAIHSGVTLGAQQLRRHLDKEFVNRVILLSDGLANVGPSRPSDLAALGSDLRREGLSVSTVGLGDDYNEDLMTALAEASHANYYYVRDAEKLPGIFSEELGAARSLIARGVSIRITVPVGVKIREIIGRPDIEVRDREVIINLPEYFGAEKRIFHARCTVEGDTRDPLEVASVDLQYRSVERENTAVQKQATAVKVQWTDDEKKSEESLRAEVAREVALFRNRLAKELAVKLADEGKVEQSIRILKDQAATNTALPPAAQSPRLAEENRNLESTAREVEAQKSFGPATRKRVQWENYQDKYQKR